MTTHPNVRLLRITNNEQSPFSSGTASSISFQSNDSDLHGINRIHLKTSIIPNTQYNINNKNNTLNLTSVDMKTIDPIPIGQYTITTFIAALKVVLDIAAAPNTFTITPDPLTFKIIIVKSGGAQFTIQDKSVNPMFMAIGQNIVKTSVGNVLQCNNIYNLSGLRHVYIESFTLGKSLLTGSIKKYAVVADVPITVPFGSFQNDIYNENTLNVIFYRGYKNISNFNMRLVDEFGDLCEFNGAPFTLVFEIHSNT